MATRSSAAIPQEQARSPVSRALRGLLVFQLFIGAVLVVGDLGGAWPALPFARPDAPELDTPVRPGDQRRRFSPGLPSQREGMPTTDLPERLVFREGRDGVLEITGAVAADDAARFVDYLSGSDATHATLNSPGGSVGDALAIGRAIRAAGLSTEVTGFCLSACPYMFAGGTARTVRAGATVGVHQHYFGESTILPAFLAVEDVQRGQAEVMAYLDEMGVDVRLMALGLSTPPDEIYVLLPDELTNYRLVTP